MTYRHIPMAVRVLVTLLGPLLASCGDDTSTNPTDTSAPAAVTNLAASSPTDSSLVLTWTAPGDDDTTGTATEYDIRYATAMITEATWASATQATGEPTPKLAGGTEMFAVTGLVCNTLYHFALKTRDEVAGHWSALSIAPSATTGACTVVNGMVLISAGTFSMGSPTGEPGRNSDETQHAVTLTKSFYLMDHEVTQEEWKVVTGANPSFFKGDVNRPVENVSWLDAVNYCNARSSQEGLTPAYAVNGSTVTWNPGANGYRLPTEAEWEFACRAGTQTAFTNGGITNTFCSPVDPNLDLMGWYCGNASSTTHPVKGKSPNALGLYGMHGNVWEWCWDWYGEYAPPYTDPGGGSSGSYRVLRGGSWDNYAQDCRSANRDYNSPDYRYYGIGFRVSRTAF